jgi:photosystem II stability/assembly factor-like uncharacterized protein
MRRFLSAALVALLLAPTAGIAASSAPAHVDASYLSSTTWRLLGPFRGGRAIAVAGVPGEPNHYYFGAVDGGVWETTNAGRTWNPIFDSENVGSIGAIAVAPSDTKTLYVGSGEADMRSDIAYGNGMYKSTDGGKTWKHIGLENTYQIGAVVVDPRDANVVYVAALGHAYAANPDRGVYKTTDGGATWNKVLFKDDDTGARDLSIDPQHPDTVYASLWQTRRPPWNTYPPSNGPGSGLYKTTDAGKTWTQLTGGLPAKVGHIGVAVAPSNPSRVYAQVDTPTDLSTGGVYRSDDAGSTWTHMAGGKDQVRIWQRGWYFGGITVDTKNPDVVYVMDTATYRSDDGGKTFNAIKGSPGGDDYHTLWINPDDPTHMVLGSDQGVTVSVDRAQTWSSWLNQPTAQLYHVITDNRFPYWVYGAQQDSGAVTVASESIHQHLTQEQTRFIDVGGENGYIAPNPQHPGKVFGGSDTVTYEDLATGWEQNIDPQTAYPDQNWRHTWTLPLVLSPVDNTLYAARQQIFASTNNGRTWKIISPDLTRGPSENHPSNLDAPTLADSSGLPKRGVVYAVAPSPIDAKLIWAGTDDGSVWITHDRGAHWNNVTPAQIGPWSKVGIIEASSYDARTAFVAIDRHRLNDYKPYIYVTNDGGAHWRPIANGIPDGSFVNVVREDPKMRGLLYAGTELGIYVSFDDGEHWQSLQRNLPISSIRDIAFNGNDVIVGTHGRSIWVIDNAAPLRQMAQAVAAGGNYLFAPVLTYRVRRAGGVGGGIADESTPIQPDEPQAPNKYVGVAIDYYLHGAASTPLVIDIVGPQGLTVRHWSSADKPVVTNPSTVDIAPQWIDDPKVPSADPGAHRFIWNYAARTEDGPFAPPDKYTIRLSVDGRTYTQTAVLARDPRINVTDAQLHAQYILALAILGKIAQIDAARAHVQRLLKSGKLSSAQATTLRRDVLGQRGPGDPDDSVGKPPTDFETLRYLDEAFNNLEGAVESADAPPTHDQNVAYAKLTSMLGNTIAKLAGIAGPT